MTRYSKDPQTDKSLHHSLKDAVAFSVMSGSIETYFSAFALVLKATVSQVALLTTLPNLLGSLAQLLSAWLGHRLNRRKPLIVYGALFQASILPFMVILPNVWPESAILVLLVSLTLYYAAGHFIAPQWMSLMGELVTAKRRGRFFGRRTSLATITSFLSLCTAGIVLHVLDKLQQAMLGFALLFAIGLIARLVSVYHLAKMHEPTQHSASIETVHDIHWLKQPAFRPALRFSRFYVLMQGMVGISAPFFAVYMLNTLHFTYLEFMANTGTSVLVQFLMLRHWGRISDVMGNRLVLQVTGWIIPFLPALWLVSPSFFYLLAIQVISGFCWAGFSLSANNILYELIPREKRATYLAVQNVTMTLGVFIGSMLGVLVTRTLPAQLTVFGVEISFAATLMWAFVLSSVMRILVSLLFLPKVQELRTPRRKTTPYELVYRFTRFNAFSGLIYEIVSKVNKSDR